MKTVEAVVFRGEAFTTFRLQCAHEYITASATLRPGDSVPCPECDAQPTRRGPQFCTDAQLDAVAAHYADTMRARGISIGLPEEVAIRRAAAIQDTWRVAFATVLK